MTSAVNAETGEATVALTEQSYRAGLWDAATFTNQQWAEAERRGVPQAKRLACVADGAHWIWRVPFGRVLTCFSPCFEILDWWHATQRL